MKRILKSRVFLVIITILLTFGTTVGAVVLYEANQVSYTPQDSSWDVDTVEKALNDLYNNLGRGTATESQVLEGATFSSNLGKELLGTMKNNGAVTATIAPGETYTIPEGYHNGEGTVTASQSSVTNSYEYVGTVTSSGSAIDYGIGDYSSDDFVAYIESYTRYVQGWFIHDNQQWKKSSSQTMSPTCSYDATTGKVTVTWNTTTPSLGATAAYEVSVSTSVIVFRKV